MNSDMPLSHLNGFFLRLRLRKLEQGLKGTRYYVACISAGNRIVCWTFFLVANVVIIHMVD